MRAASVRQYWHLGCALLLLALALPGQASEPGIQAELPAARIQQLLDSGIGALNKGNPETAIREYFEPVIQSFQSRYAQSDKRVFSARSPAESLLYLASAAASAKDGKAEKRDAIVVSGAWSDALHLEGFALIELERFDEAKVALRRAIEIAPLFAPAWNELGAVLQVEKDWPAALAAYTSAAEGANIMANDNPAWKNAQLSRALRGQGYVLVETDRLDEAEALYKRCLEINADDATAKTEIRYIAQLRSKRHVSP